MTLCNTCKKADVSCPVYPMDTQKCVEYAPHNQCDGCSAGMLLIQGLHYHDNAIHMACTNGLTGVPQRKADIAFRLQKLAVEIEDIATAMDYYGGFASWAKHSREMIGAAGLCREWSSEILAESV